MRTKFWQENLKGRYYLEDLGEDGRMRLESILREIACRCVDWIYMAQDMDK
jgi:hypothetical protein